MVSIISRNTKTSGNEIYLVNKQWMPPESLFSIDEINYIEKKIKEKNDTVFINRYKNFVAIALIRSNTPEYKTKEKLRNIAYKICNVLNDEKIEQITVVDKNNNPGFCLSFVEGLILSNYKFSKYFTENKNKPSRLKKIYIKSNNIKPRDVEELKNITDAVEAARNLVSEPLSVLNAVKLSEEIISYGKKAGYKTEVFNKKKIETLKMGGLLAVNKGSVDPPTFSILEWKPEKTKNKKPVILVGKGIVFDTGGINLKPGKSMDTMKCDMAGAAAVTGAMYAIASNKLPVHVIALIPATDNRPGGNAYVPQDIITMYNGKTVEVLNTDAEGRMILADALSYAKKYNPELVIDLATLTGSAVAAIGHYGIVGMGNAKQIIFNKLRACGDNVYERVVEFPFWDEYNETLKSDYADIKNIGGKDAGAITAGKFLEHFTDYPFIHLDIAGPAYLSAVDSYRGKGGTGVGVRLLYEFVKNLF